MPDAGWTTRCSSRSRWRSRRRRSSAGARRCSPEGRRSTAAICRRGSRARRSSRRGSPRVRTRTPSRPRSRPRSGRTATSRAGPSRRSRWRGCASSSPRGSPPATAPTAQPSPRRCGSCSARPARSPPPWRTTARGGSSPGSSRAHGEAAGAGSSTRQRRSCRRGVPPTRHGRWGSTAPPRARSTPARRRRSSPISRWTGSRRRRGEPSRSGPGGRRRAGRTSSGRAGGSTGSRSGRVRSCAAPRIDLRATSSRT